MENNSIRWGGGEWGQGVARKKLEFELLAILLCVIVEVSFLRHGGFNVTDVRRERISLLWSTVDSRKNSVVQRFLF